MGEVAASKLIAGEIQLDGICRTTLSDIRTSLCSVRSLSWNILTALSGIVAHQELQQILGRWVSVDSGLFLFSFKEVYKMITMVFSHALSR